MKNRFGFPKLHFYFLFIILLFSFENTIWGTMHYTDNDRQVQATSNALPWLITFGNKIVTANTRQEVILRGANSMYSEWHNNMDWENRAIPELASNWKGNVLVHGFAADPINENNVSYLSMMDQYVRLTAANHIYLVFSWRSYLQGGDQPTMPDHRITQALVKLAARYKGDSHIIYSLQVEPHDVTWEILRPQFETMIDAIRQTAAPYVPLIMVASSDWAGNLNAAISDPVKRPNVVYNTHPYIKAADFQEYFGNAYDAGLPVFVGEFGPWGGSSMTMIDVTALLDFTKQRHIGWAAWNLDYDTDPLLNFDLTPTVPFGATVKNEMRATPPIPDGTITPNGIY